MRSGPRLPRRLSRPSPPVSVVPCVPWIMRVRARVGSWTGSASTMCSQLRMSPLRTAWALEMPPGFAYGLM